MIAIDTSKQPFTDETNSTWVYSDDTDWVKIDMHSTAMVYSATAVYTGDGSGASHGTLLVKSGETVYGTTGENIDGFTI